MMDLVYFIHELNSDVEDFRSWWIIQAKENPESYPIDMDRAEWFEQFTFWLSRK